jgi:sigma-B regulation protein RsbU (phosphoserine phosphatase)
LIFATRELQHFVGRYFVLIVVSMIKDMLLICGVIIGASRLMVRPLQSLTRTMEDITQGNWHTPLPELRQQDEVGQLNRSFIRMRNPLREYIHKLQETTAARQKLESELAIASQIQNSMLPQSIVTASPHSAFDVPALHQPARIVGGDLYDFFFVDEQPLLLVIGDVADKGIPAALSMAETVALIRIQGKQISEPSQILAAVNRELCHDNADCQFVTLFYGVLNLKTGVLHYASGGHDAPILLSQGQGRLLSLETGSPLRLDSDPNDPSQFHSLHRNDLLLLYTDGITEALSAYGTFFFNRSPDRDCEYPPKCQSLTHNSHHAAPLPAISGECASPCSQFNFNPPILFRRNLTLWSGTLPSISSRRS